MKRGLKYDFTLLAILLIPVGVAINFVSSQIVQLLRLPVHLDTIGTIVVSMIAGPWVGAVTGLCTNLVNSITNPTSLFFAPVSILIGLVVGFMSKGGMFKKVWKMIVAAIIITLVTTLVASPTAVIVFGGATGKSVDAVTAVFLASGKSIWTSVISGAILVESVDKILSVVVAFFVVKKMSPRYLSKLNYGASFISTSKKDNNKISA